MNIPSILVNTTIYASTMKFGRLPTSSVPDGNFINVHRRKKIFNIKDEDFFFKCSLHSCTFKVLMNIKNAICKELVSEFLILFKCQCS